MKTVAIIQARMGSTRLPGKMMLDIGGKPAVQHVFERVRCAKNIHEVWLATTTNPADDTLVLWAKNFGVPCFRGSENDVLDRYYQTAKKAEADVVVRVTADCPLADPMVIDQVVGVFVHGGYDYVSNVHPPTFPDGLDIEVFSVGVLERAWQEATLHSEREHVTPYIWKHPEVFRIQNVSYQPLATSVDLSHHRWTLDTVEDLEFIRRIMDELKRRSTPVSMGMHSVFDILAQHPDWLLVNAGHARNEGYTKSLEEEKNL